MKDVIQNVHFYMLQMQIPLVDQLAVHFYEIAYQTSQYYRIFAEFLIVDTNIKKKNMLIKL